MSHGPLNIDGSASLYQIATETTVKAYSQVFLCDVFNVEERIIPSVSTVFGTYNVSLGICFGQLSVLETFKPF